jgi:hypothetical protein
MARVATMYCRRRLRAVALQKYSYLGNLPPLVIWLRVNVYGPSLLTRQFQRNPTYISISMLSGLKALMWLFVLKVFDKHHAIASS